MILRTPYTCLVVGISVLRQSTGQDTSATANLRTKIPDFSVFDSSIILIVQGGILMTIGKLPESLSQAILAGVILVGRLGAASIGGSNLAARRCLPSRRTWRSWQASLARPGCPSAIFVLGSANRDLIVQTTQGATFDVTPRSV